MRRLVKQGCLIIVGPPGCGKTHASLILGNMGWNIVSAGDIIRRICKAQGLDTNRQNLQRIGAELLIENGEYFFAQLLMEQAGDAPLIVFDGIRPKGVVEHIRRNMGCRVIYVKAEQSLRYKRLQERDEISKVEFESLENNNLERQVCQLESIADITITNDSNPNKYETAIKEVGVNAAIEFQLKQIL